MAQAGISVLDYVATHGTGTPLVRAKAGHACPPCCLEGRAAQVLGGAHSSLCGRRLPAPRQNRRTAECASSHLLHLPGQGDPIESSALRKAAVHGDIEQLPSDYVFTVGAVKALTGHLEGSAGWHACPACCSNHSKRGC
jgi:3-oxoacyl-(acyl-carrier-protein) synthase